MHDSLDADQDYARAYSTSDSAPPTPPPSTVLDDRPLSRWPRLLQNFWHIPALGLMYLAHVRYRRYSPRRLPPLTCLKVPEIYGYTTVAWTVWGVTNELKEEVMDDPDLHLIEMTARTLKRTIWSDERQMKDIVAFLDSGVRDRAREMRADMYRELAGDGWWKKLLWWHDHVWATEETWYRAAVVWTTKCGHPNGENALRDWDFCFTHLANTVQSDDDKDFDYTDYGNKAMIPFAITIPLALLARWTRRPWLIFPVHGLQRTLYWLSLYPDTMQEYQHYDFLRRCKNKHGVVENIRYKGNFDTKISRMVS